MKITITCHQDNSFSFIVVGYTQVHNVSVAWNTNRWALHNFTTNELEDMGSDVLPDWNSIMQYLQELN